MSEADLSKKIHKTLGGRPNVRLFRNQVGAYQLKDGRWVMSGLARGSADLVGWKTIQVTPEMVGQTLAVFLSVEVKSPKGAIRPEQKTWLKNVRKSGGIAGICRTIEEAEDLIK